MLTGDASVNAQARLVCCTAEVLANIALREGAESDIAQVVMDEFHFYTEPDRGWAWQVPLLELPRAQFLLMSATLGDTARFEEDLIRRTGRPTVSIASGERPVPLFYSWAMTPLHETVTELLDTHRAPVYIVHFTQAAALERAQSLLVRPGGQPRTTRRDRRADRRVPLLARVRANAEPVGTPRDRGSPRRDAAASTGASWSSSPSAACCRWSAVPTPSASASTCRSGPCSSPP